MSSKHSKTLADYEEEAILKYEKEHSGAFSMEEVADELLADGWEVNVPSKKAVLTKRLKRRARELRSTDEQGRKVRTMHAAKITKHEAGGGEVTEVVYDHRLGMSFEHALTSFQQRYENCSKQEKSLWRDLDSFNDNNPNAKLQKIQKEFLFIDGDVEETQEVETIQESATPRRLH